MADIAVLGRRDMRRIGLGAFADRVGAVMTGIAAVAGHGRSAVIDEGIGEQCGVVAGAAILSGVAMNRRVGCTERTGGDMIGIAIMTGHAVVGDPLVGEGRRYKCSHRMADMAVLRGGQVAGRLDPVHRRQEVINVAAFTTTGDAAVYRAREIIGQEVGRRGMALTAFAQRRDMVDRLATGDAGVVAHRAVVRVYPLVVVHRT